MSSTDISFYQESISTLKSQYQALLDAEQEEDSRLVQSYSDRLKLIHQQYQKLPATLPRPETIPAIFNRAYDENFISDYLAYVLDPNRNGIGSDPLKALLRMVSIEVEEVEFEDVELYREYTLDTGRIDLLIFIDGVLVIGIENKILSGEGDNQTSYYARVIRREFKDYHHALIFLSPGGTKPKSKHFQPVSYAQLLEAFRGISYNWTADLKKSVIWEDFLKHLEGYIVSDKTSFEFSPRSELFLEYYQMLSDLSQAFSDDWGRLLDFIEARLRTHKHERDWEIKFNKGRTYWHQIYKQSWQQNDLWVHYEYFFDSDRLTMGQLDFMVDVEGSKKNIFFEIFAKKYSKMIDEYEAKSIVYRPNHRQVSLAWKTYNFDSPFEKWDQRFIEAFDEFTFLTPHIEAVLADYTASVESSA